jgi:hypothetical protein
VTTEAHLDAEEIEFMRWKAERWMKCVTCQAPSDTIRASCCSTVARCSPTLSRIDVAIGVGLEERTRPSVAIAPFADAMRQYLDWPDPLPVETQGVSPGSLAAQR